MSGYKSHDQDSICDNDANSQYAGMQSRVTIFPEIFLWSYSLYTLYGNSVERDVVGGRNFLVRSQGLGECVGYGDGDG